MTDHQKSSAGSARPTFEEVEANMPTCVSELARELASAALDDIEGEPYTEDRHYAVARWFDAVMNAPAQPTPEPNEAEIEAWIRTLDTEKSKNLLMWRQRSLDAEADALRLHREKMEMYERAIAAEAKLAAHECSSAVTVDDPADLWDKYCAETPRKSRSPQGAMAFAFSALTSTEPQTSAVQAERDRCVALCEGWMERFEGVEIQYTSPREYACDAINDIMDLIRDGRDPSSQVTRPKSECK